jgi:hypothetical protein
MRYRMPLCAAVLAVGAWPCAASAQEADTAVAASVYLPADFARFNPRNALEMVRQVPGFAIRGEDEQRGLGQATGNVLIDGERVASKSDTLFDQLRRITAGRVERIEILDGATLGIPGLSGQVANVITTPGGISGRFEYRANMRPRYARPSYFGGEASLSGSDSDVEWTVAYNHGVGRGAAGGPGGTILDPFGAVTQTRDVRLRFVGEFPRLSGNVSWEIAPDVGLKVNGSYERRYENFSDDEQRDLVTGVDRFRDFDNRNRGYEYELGGELTFPLAGGDMKLVGLNRFNHNRGRSDSLLIFADGSPAVGDRFAALTESGERVARAEYGWAMLGGTWQLDGEAAFNRLHRSAQLFTLTPSGTYDEVPFPGSSGGVTEDRYEVILNHNRTLAPGLTLQTGAGAEFSTLAQTGTDGLTRRFQRPKGSLSLAWAPQQGRDISLRLARTVGQLSFGDFLASVSLKEENQNAGNVRLVPPQSWEADVELRESLGPWGSTHVKLYARLVEDLIEIIPVEGGLETNGNVDHARELGVEWSSTIELAPTGFRGARLEATLNANATRLRDPLTGERRAYSGQNNIYSEVSLRHDVPGTDWAWGAGLEYNHILPFYRLSEVSRDWEGPIYTFAFIEHKDVLGMTANLNVFNITNGRGRFERTVYAGYRDRSPVVFTERRNLGIQPIFQLSLKGDF